MQKKFGTVLNDSLLSAAKIFCQQKHTTMSRLIEDAIREYLQKAKPVSSDFSAVEVSFGALKVPPRALRTILEEDIDEVD